MEWKAEMSGAKWHVRRRVGGGAFRLVVIGFFACLVFADCGATRKETKVKAADPVAELFMGYAGAEWDMSPAEVKGVYAKYRVAAEERVVDFGKERRRLVLESDRVSREFVFEQRGKRLVVRRMSVTWVAWDDKKFESIRSGLAGKWGGPHDSKDVFGVPYDKWEFEDATTGAQVRATLLAPRKPLLSYTRAAAPGPPADPAGQPSEGEAQFGETLPPTLSILYADRPPKARRTSQGKENDTEAVETTSKTNLK